MSEINEVHEPATNGGVYYRYDDFRNPAPQNAYGKPAGLGDMEVVLCEYPVPSTSPLGAWLSVDGAKKFVLGDSKLAFAAATVEAAQALYVTRKKLQASAYRRRMYDAEAALDLFKFQFPVLKPHKPDADLMTLAEFEENEDAGVFGCDDGMGYYATVDGRSDIVVGRGGVPAWATHVDWYNR